MLTLRRTEAHTELRAEARTFPPTGMMMAGWMQMMAITVSSSMRVNARRRPGARRLGSGPVLVRGRFTVFMGVGRKANAGGCGKFGCDGRAGRRHFMSFLSRPRAR